MIIFLRQPARSGCSYFFFQNQTGARTGFNVANMAVPSPKFCFLGCPKVYAAEIFNFASRKAKFWGGDLANFKIFVWWLFKR